MRRNLTLPVSFARYCPTGRIVLTMHKRDNIEDHRRWAEDSLVLVDHHIAEGEKRISRQMALIAKEACEGRSTTRAEAMLQVMRRSLTLMCEHREAILRQRGERRSSVLFSKPCERQPVKLLQQSYSTKPCHLTFQPTSVNTGSSDMEGQLVFANRQLVAVLVRLNDEAHLDDVRDGWFLEAGFGPCAMLQGEVFLAIAEAAAWISERIADASNKEVQLLSDHCTDPSDTP